MNVDSMKWGEFKICDLFEVYTGALVNQSEFSNGKIPRITATDLNNGIAFFTQNVENKNFRTLENFISISFLGSVFYQKNKVSLDMKIHAIKPKNKELNVYIALFLIPLIKNFTFKYMYGYQLSTHILKIQKLILPIDSKGNPNYAFMESFMKNLEQKHLRKIIKYYKNKLLDSNGGGGGNICHPPYLTESSLCYTDSISCHTDFLSRHTDLLPCHTEQSEVSQRHNEQSHTFTTKQNLATFLEGSLMEIAKNELSLESVQWDKFKFSLFFKNYHGKRLVERDREQGKTPLLTAGEANNGVASFIGNETMKKYKDFISIDMFGNAFYHSYEATGDDNIYFFINEKLSLCVKLFLVACINKQKSKFSYGKQFRQQNADSLTIMLPIDSKGNPHYEFMESFMKNLEQKHLQKILAYYTHKLDSSGGGGGNTL